MTHGFLRRMASKFLERECQQRPLGFEVYRRFLNEFLAYVARRDEVFKEQKQKRKKKQSEPDLRQ